MDNLGAFLDAVDVFYIAPHDSRVEQMEAASGCGKKHSIRVRG